jgi:hypothetical protein
MFVWSGTAWTEISSSADIISYKYTVAGGATSVTGADDNGLTLSYTVGKEQVYINGVLQVRGSDYTASTGTSITGMLALTANDIVTVLAFTAFVVANTYTIAQADATFIPDAIVDAKGDLIVASAADTVARLAAGSNGETLVADSSTSTGLRYQGSMAAGKNAALNGAIEIAQRGNSANLGFGVTRGPDRFYTNTGTSPTGTISRETLAPGTIVSGIDFQYYLRTNITAISGSGFFDVFTTDIEDVRTFAGQTVTVSLWVKAAANADYTLFLGQNFGTGGSSTVFLAETISVTTSWQRISKTFALPSISGKTITSNSSLSIFCRAPSISTLTFDMTGLQLELGSVATTFSRAAGTIQGELSACQRYYQRYKADSIFDDLGYSGKATNSTEIYASRMPFVPFRVAPTSIDFANVTWIPSWGAGVTAVSNITFSSYSSADTPLLVFTTTGVTAGTLYIILAGNNSNAFIGLSAEL